VVGGDLYGASTTHCLVRQRPDRTRTRGVIARAAADTQWTAAAAAANGHHLLFARFCPPAIYRLSVSVRDLLLLLLFLLLRAVIIDTFPTPPPPPSHNTIIAVAARTIKFRKLFAAAAAVVCVRVRARLFSLAFSHLRTFFVRPGARFSSAAVTLTNLAVRANPFPSRSHVVTVTSG